MQEEQAMQQDQNFQQEGVGHDADPTADPIGDGGSETAEGNFPFEVVEKTFLR